MEIGIFHIHNCYSQYKHYYVTCDWQVINFAYCRVDMERPFYIMGLKKTVDITYFENN